MESLHNSTMAGSQ